VKLLLDDNLSPKLDAAPGRAGQPCGTHERAELVHALSGLRSAASSITYRR